MSQAFSSGRTAGKDSVRGVGTVGGVAAPSTMIRRRVRTDLGRLVQRNLDLHDFARQATSLVKRVVPSDGTCLLTLDPATLLPTGEVVDNALPPETTPRLAEIELGEPDVNKFAELSRRPVPAASLSGSTGGDLDRSRRHRELRAPSGFGDELRVALADDTGTWAALTLLRTHDRPDFTNSEVRFVASVAPVLVDGVRRALVESPTSGSAAKGVEPGLLVLAADGTLEMANQSADHWLGELEDVRASGLPKVIRIVAHRARHEGDDDGLARARVRTPRGTWLVVRGSPLGAGADARVAVHVEEARATELAPLIVAAYGLTERERTVTELIARGYPTNDIAARLGVSAYTVQDHLKSIFAKSGTASRAELVARLFLDHQPPSLTPPDADSQPSRVITES
jgi:DNA-binding CsgD family transcriptional regulator